MRLVVCMGLGIAAGSLLPQNPLTALGLFIAAMGMAFGGVFA
jgi:hypothetical protein